MQLCQRVSQQHISWYAFHDIHGRVPLSNKLRWCHTVTAKKVFHTCAVLLDISWAPQGQGSIDPNHSVLSASSWTQKSACCVTHWCEILEQIEPTDGRQTRDCLELSVWWPWKRKAKGHERLFGMVEMLHVLIVGVVTWMCTFAKTCSTVHLTQAHFISCKLFLKADFFKR